MPTVLVVDDERPIVELVEQYLAREGYAVLTAAGGRRWRGLGPKLLVSYRDGDGAGLLAAGLAIALAGPRAFANHMARLMGEPGMGGMMGPGWWRWPRPSTRS